MRGALNVTPPSVEFETDTPLVPATHTPSNGSTVVQFVQIAEKKKFVALLREKAAGKISVETGEFGAMMDVELVNDGPVTLILER